MISHAINSGAINTVPFPASELGASIVELIGTIEVVCEPAIITVRITTAATSTPTANLSANTTSKILLGATTEPSAVVTAIAAKQKMRQSAVSSGKATASSSLTMWRLSSAIVQATATATAASYQLAKKSASGTAQATTSVSSLKQLYRSASIASIAAVSTPDSKRKMVFSIAQAGAAVGRTGFSFKSRLPATTTARALAQAQPLSYIRLNPVKASPAVVSIATAKLLMRSTPEFQLASAATGLTNLRLKLRQGALSSARATAQDADATYRFQMSASTVANAMAYSTATDYTTKIPAPSERQIVVPAYDRAMKVI